MEVLCAGSFMCDIIVADLPFISEPGGLVYAPKGIHLAVGGHAANVAVDLVQLGQKDVGAVGCIGNDLWGRFIEDHLTSCKIDLYPQIMEDVRTAKNIALIVEGQDRRFFAELAANTFLSKEHVAKILEEHIPFILYLGTIGGLRYIDKGLGSLLKTARKIGCVNAVDVVPPKFGDWSHLENAMQFIDILHLNDKEARSLTRQEDLKKSLQIINEWGISLCLLSLGNKGLLASNGGRILFLPPFIVNEIEPTGAGDALFAGFIHSFLSKKVCYDELECIPDMVLKHALLQGAAAGSSCVTEVGATKAVTEIKVKNLIREQGEKIRKGIREKIV